MAKSRLILKKKTFKQKILLYVANRKVCSNNNSRVSGKKYMLLKIKKVSISKNLTIILLRLYFLIIHFRRGAAYNYLRYSIRIKR